MNPKAAQPEQKTQITTQRTNKTNNRAETTETTHKTCTDSARASSSTRLFFARSLSESFVWSYKHVQYRHMHSNNSLKQSDKRTNKHVHASHHLRQNTWRGVASRGLALLGLQTRILQNLPVTKRNRTFTQKHRQQQQKDILEKRSQGRPRPTPQSG